MNNINVCQSIKCPYFCSHGNNYGCQRYNIATRCHLLERFELEQSGQYALYIGNSELLAPLQSANNHFFEQDSKYKDDIDFQKSHPDWFTPNAFQVKSLPSPND